MSERESRPDLRGAGDDELGLADLLRRAGPRAELDEADLQAIAETARSAWRFQVRRRQRRRRLVLAAGLAALLSVAVALSLRTADFRGPAAVARIAAAGEPLELTAPSGAISRGAVGDSIAAGAVLETGDSGAAVTLLPGGSALRLDRDSRVVFSAAGSLELRHGALYVDSGEHAGDGVRIRTPLGTTRDVGTQFSLRLLTAGDVDLEVRVRSGAVAVEHAGGEVVAGAAEELVVRAEGGVERRPFPADDPAWAWAIAAAPRFDVEGRTLGEVLRWACRESGWTLRYGDPTLEREAESIRVRGGLGSLPANQAPFAVLPGAGLDGSVADGTLTVRRAP